MFRLEKEFKFEASHQLMDHDGKCARLHGHSWKGKLVCEGRNLILNGPKKNMLIDYGDIGAVAKELVAKLDHQDLNEVLNTDMPTSEFIAQWCYETARGSLGAILVAVSIEETSTSKCTYWP